MYNDYYDPQMQPKHKPGKGFAVFFIVMIAVIALIAATGAYLFFALDIHTTVDGNGIYFTRGEMSSLPPQTTPPVKRPQTSYTPQIGTGGGDADVSIVDIPREASEENGKLALTEIYQKVAPCVVGIVAENDYYQSPSSGSGIVMREDGYIITNNHVIEGSSKITVVLENGDEYPATLVGRDAQTDLAVIKADVKGWTSVTFGNSDNLLPGDLAVAIGNPMGLKLQNTMTVGYISAINRNLTVGNHEMTLLQFDTSVNPGNSGGPLINEHGQVIGIISSKIMSNYTSSYTLEGLGFAIPINSAAPIINELISNGYISGRPTIGITDAVEVDEQSARFFNYPLGIMVRAIHPDSDAAKQGLAVNDIITHVDGEEVTTIAEVNAMKAGIGVGGEITVTVFRNRETLDITFKLSDEGALR